MVKGTQPRVYVYTEPQFADRPWTGDRQGVGLLKIGFTSTGDSEKRIRQQFPTAKPGDTPFQMLLDVEAVTNAGADFMDHEVHSRLVRDGVRRIFTSDGGRTEWFECTLAEVEHAIAEIKAGRSFDSQRHLTYAMRPEQIAAVEKAAAYFVANPQIGDGSAPKFLWNAKMRFGKTFATFQLAKRMGWKRILVLTYKPAVATEWEQELMRHVDFDGWQFVHRDGLQLEEADPNRPICVFASLQDILGTEERGGKRVGKARFEEARKIDWDCVALDEYHFGAHRDGAKSFYEPEAVDGAIVGVNEEDLEVEKNEMAAPDADELPLKRRSLLFLSGTPFRALSSGEFMEDQIYTWSYADEQRAKAAWKSETEPNPYRMLPEMTIATYELSPALRAVAEKGETNEFSLNELFRAEWPKGANGKPDRSGQPKFVHEPEVMHFLEFISGRHMTTAFTEDGRKIETHAPLGAGSGADHTLWFLPDVASCKAMGELLERKSGEVLFGDIAVVIAAGSEAGMGAKAKEPVLEAIASGKRRTFTLSCMKLTTGVTVPQWSAVLIMRDITSPETYFQTAFRAQSPWTESDPSQPDKIRVLKERCVVYDFSPQRAINLIFEYCSNNNRDGRKIEHVLDEFVGLLPIYAFAGGVNERMNANKIWDYAAVGIGATMLARRWQSTLLVRVDSDTLSRVLNYPELVKALDNLEQFRSLKRNVRDDMRKIIAAEEVLRKPPGGSGERRMLTPEESAIDKVNRKAKQELREKLVKFLARVPHFMYLTDFREEALQDVIRELDSALFERVTGMKVADFDQLAQLGLFNKALINQAILAFRRFEEGSLNYVGGGRVIKRVGAFDTSVTPDERDAVLGIPARVPFAIKPIAADRSGRSVRQMLLDLIGVGVFAFGPSEALVRRYGAGTKICIYEKGVGVIAWVELAGPVSMGSRARRVLSDPDLYPLEAPIGSSGWVEPAVAIDNKVLRSELDWLQGKPDKTWQFLVRGPMAITEHDYLLLTRHMLALGPQLARRRQATESE